jgi:hypothetical protein
MGDGADPGTGEDDPDENFLPTIFLPELLTLDGLFQRINPPQTQQKLTLPSWTVRGSST